MNSGRGDLIFTGTPAGSGLGRSPVEYLKRGLVTSSIEGAGRIHQQCFYGRRRPPGATWLSPAHSQPAEDGVSAYGSRQYQRMTTASQTAHVAMRRDQTATNGVSSSLTSGHLNEMLLGLWRGHPLRVLAESEISARLGKPAGGADLDAVLTELVEAGLIYVSEPVTLGCHLPQTRFVTRLERNADPDLLAARRRIDDETRRWQTRLLTSARCC